MPEFRKRPTKRAQELRNDATDAERRLWTQLSRRQLEGLKFSRQIPVGPFICDFMCREKALVVELDGGQHSEQVTRDGSRTRYLELQGFTVVRFWNNDVFDNIDGVLRSISATARELSSVFTNVSIPPADGNTIGASEGPSGTISPHPQPPPASGRGLE